MNKLLLVISILGIGCISLISGCSGQSVSTQSEIIGSVVTDTLASPGDECISKEDCELPGDFAIQSNCPFSPECIEGICRIICPLTFPAATVEDNDATAVCTQDADCNCDERGSRSLKCICKNGSCLSIEM